MARFCVFALVLSVALLAPASTFAEDKKTPEVPARASDEEAASALAIFKVNWKARGLKGDDKLMQREMALRQIAPIQHPEIIKAIGKGTKSSDEDLRLVALIYLGDQKAHPHLAAKYIIEAMRKHKKDTVLMMTGLQALGELKYLGAKKEIQGLLKHKYYVIKKTAIATVGDIGDVRLLSDVLKLLGIKTEKDGGDQEPNSGGKEVEEGYSWEGAEAEVDRGEADNTKENADAKKIAEQKIAANKAAAEAKAGKSGAGAPAGASGGGGGGRGGMARSPKELIPTILKTLKKLTGEEFDKPSQVRGWLHKNRERVEKQKKDLNAQEKVQKAQK